MNRLAPIGKNGRAASVGPERFMASVTLRQIRYFIAVAETGKISTAASMVGISPSVVTDAIQELEILSGTKLFQRQPRGLDLTYDGHRFLAHCRNILSAVEGANHAMSRPDSEMAGTLTLATTITVAGYFLAPLLSRFQNTFPEHRGQGDRGKKARRGSGPDRRRLRPGADPRLQPFQPAEPVEPYAGPFDAPAVAAAEASAAQPGSRYPRRRRARSLTSSS